MHYNEKQNSEGRTTSSFISLTEPVNRHCLGAQDAHCFLDAPVEENKETA